MMDVAMLYLALVLVCLTSGFVTIILSKKLLQIGFGVLCFFIAGSLLLGNTQLQIDGAIFVLLGVLTSLIIFMSILKIATVARIIEEETG